MGFFISSMVEKRKKKPWPTKKAMEQVYELNLWGGKEEFYSGEGSHSPEIKNPYINAVKLFLTSFSEKQIVCDLGCGDFNIGKELVKYTQKYIAVDIAENIIERNKNVFKNENLEFHCLDIATDKLPKGDCVILRQVLQHLSNEEIQQILNKMSDFKYVILTEHIPNGNFEANKNIIAGQGIRLKKHSGVNVMASPFYFKVKAEKELLSLILENDKGVIVTTLYTIF